MKKLVSLYTNGATYPDDPTRSSKEVFLQAVRNNPSAIGISFQVTGQAGGAEVSKETGYSPVDQGPVADALKGFGARVERGKQVSVEATRGAVDIDSLAEGARIRVPAGSKLELRGTGDYRMPAYVSIESASPAHDASVGSQTFAGKGIISFQVPLTGKPGSFEVEVAVPFATHEDVWNATKLSHMTAGLSADSTYLRKRVWVDVDAADHCQR